MSRSINPNVFVTLCSRCGQHHDKRITCGSLGKATMITPVSTIPSHGRNWQYILADGTALYRNIASVEADYDGWWHDTGMSTVPTLISGQYALCLLRASRLTVAAR
jgi:hypothetical protein